MKARDFMTKNVTTCKQNQTVAEAAKIMIEGNFSIMPIVNDQEELVGIVTESDFVGKSVQVPHALVSLKSLFGQSFHSKDVESLYSEAKKKLLKDVMSKKIVSVTTEDSLDSIVELMISKNFKRLPVMENKKLVGIITRRDILKAFNSSKD